ncbi:MAG TPA: hypothetical protein VL172_15215, partial [Kofleriaceae bacterium]|nr:hypothetical protein [Kofleriaceae bacterium]
APRGGHAETHLRRRLTGDLAAVLAAAVRVDPSQRLSAAQLRGELARLTPSLRRLPWPLT